MSTSADRISGAFFVLLAMALYFYVIPTFVEQAEDGNIAPATMPNLVAIVMGLCGVVVMIRPTAHETPDLRLMARAALFAGVIALAIYAMSWVGFVYVAPVFALILMGMIGERRLLWLLIGAAGMPGLIWFLVTQVLDRVLP